MPKYKEIKIRVQVAPEAVLGALIRGAVAEAPPAPKDDKKVVR